MSSLAIPKERPAAKEIYLTALPVVSCICAFLNDPIVRLLPGCSINATVPACVCMFIQGWKAACPILLLLLLLLEAACPMLLLLLKGCVPNDAAVAFAAAVGCRCA